MRCVIGTMSLAHSFPSCCNFLLSGTRQPWKQDRYIYLHIHTCGALDCMLRLFSFRLSSTFGANLCLYRYSVANKLSFSYSYSTLNNLNKTDKMALLGGAEKKHKVTIVGSGNWYEKNHSATIFCQLLIPFFVQGIYHCQDHCREYASQQGPLRGGGPDVGV